MRIGENWSIVWSPVAMMIAFALSMICTAAHGGLDPTSKVQCSTRDPLMDPVNEIFHGQEVVWQVPPNPTGVLFVAHAFNKDPFSYFDPGRRCQKCYGLPEDRTIVLEGLRRGFAVIAVKSIGVAFDVWPLDDSRDLVIVLSAIDKVRKDHSLESLPFMAFGHSAGGYLATVLSLKLPMQALLLSYCEGQSEVVENAIPFQFPPTFFLYMGFDEDSNAKSTLGVTPSTPMTTKADILKSMAVLLERGVQVAGKECEPKRLYPHFFTERIRCMTNEMSEKVYEAYKAEGWLDADNFLTKNAYVADWKSVLWKWNALPFCEKAHDLCLAPHVCQELNMAYAVHGSTGDGNDEMYSWLDSTLASSDPVLSASQ